MANKQNTQANRETNPPAFVAWHVNGQDKKAFWTRIGAAWDHKDGKGLAPMLEGVLLDNERDAVGLRRAVDNLISVLVSHWGPFHCC